MDGWICLHRKMVDWEWYDDVNTFKLFMHLLLSATYKNDDYKGEKLKPGDVFTGRKRLSIDSGLSEQQIRTSLKKLERTNEITIKSTKKYSIISITKWMDYQSINQQINQEATKKQPSSNHTQQINNIPVGTEPPSLDKLLFDLGRKTLGDKAGSIIAKLKKEKGIAEAYNIIELATTKSDPTQYVMACLKPKKIGITPLGVGG